jgi:tetratricopeptide (TPR) repeat protein
LLDGHPSEPELHDRARIFLAFCERHLDHPTTPRTLEERIDAATIALNRGRFDEAEHLLSRVTRDAPNHDYAHFMLAVARTGRGAFDAALAALDRAVALNPENRLLAMREPDLEPLRRVTGFQRTVNRTAGATAAR